MTEKRQTFLLTVAILEGRHYAWLNMDSAVIVKIDSKFKCTSVKRKTDCPFYNEYFVFEFYTTFHDMIEKQMSVTVIEPRNIWRKRKTLGYITLDIATVWQQKNHQFYHKWAILTAPKMETFTGPQGYIKMDISILSRSEVPKVPLHIINDEIEGFDNRLYRQIERAIIGSALSTVISSVFMGYFENKALNNASMIAARIRDKKYFERAKEQIHIREHNITNNSKANYLCSP